MNIFKFGNCSTTLKGELMNKTTFDATFKGKLKGYDLGTAYTDYKAAHKARAKQIKDESKTVGE